MLSRIANNLFWMGCYIERVEHYARFTKVNYFAALDAPANISNKFSINSLLRMNGVVGKKSTSVEKVLNQIGFDKENQNSIINCVTAVRENARSARDILSTELWETINRYYHFTLNYDSDAFSKTNLFDFSQKIIEQTSIIKGRIDSTLIHNDAWLVISLGIFVERSSQILRIISTKLEDLKKIKNDDNSLAIKYHQIETMLRSLESFDMSRKHYRQAPDLENSLEFLLLNPKFPRSILSCSRKIKKLIVELEGLERFPQDSAGFKAGKLVAELNFLTIEEIMEDKEDYILNLQNRISDINNNIIRDYLS
ncbi:MAG: alpha-E domain-containing protein [Lentisphaeraceae bacterium]|nr:alpha-E domain-containing protein [Lentisphaeraceae bacterium]